MNPATLRDEMRNEIAQRAARLIAEDGLDYGSAKQKAARDTLGMRLGERRGPTRIPSDWLPDNASIEEEVRQYQELFQAETQPQRLRSLREAALGLMQWLEAGLIQAGLPNRPIHVTGTIVNGTAGEHSDIHLQLFVDSAKDVEIFLLNQQIDFDVQELPHRGRADGLEVIRFMWASRQMPRQEGVHLQLYETDALRFGNRQREARLDRAGLQRLLE